MYYWLSFADPDLPEGTQFLGAVIVYASDFITAIKVSHHLKINPGGEVQGMPIPVEKKIPSKWIECLLSKEECEEFDREMIK